LHAINFPFQEQKVLEINPSGIVKFQDKLELFVISTFLPYGSQSPSLG
jgi:hypothetical protein